MAEKTRYPLDMLLLSLEEWIAWEKVGYHYDLLAGLKAALAYAIARAEALQEDKEWEAERYDWQGILP